jgi:hypothetical protein
MIRMDLSNLLATGSNVLTKLTESPIATPLALAGVAALLKNYAPRLASGLAGQAVQEIFRPREEKRRGQELLMRNPNLTSTPAPPGYKGPTMSLGGMDIRRLGTLGQEYPAQYGPGAVGAASDPIRGLLGNLPAGPHGELAATKYGIDAAMREQRSKKAATSRDFMLDYYAQHPELGVALSTGKEGDFNVGLKTMPPRTPVSPKLVPTVNERGETIYSFIEPTGNVRPTAAKVPPKAGASGSTKYQAVRKGDKWVYLDKEGKEVSGIGGPIQQGPNWMDQLDYRENLQLLNKQITETNAELSKMRRAQAPPEDLADLEKKLQDLNNQKVALQQTTREASAPAGKGGSPSSAARSYLQQILK